MIRWQHPVRQRLLQLEEERQQLRAGFKKIFFSGSTGGRFLDASRSRFNCSSSSSSSVPLFRWSSTCCCRKTWRWSISSNGCRSSSTCRVTGGISAGKGEDKCRSPCADRSSIGESSADSYMLHHPSSSNSTTSSNDASAWQPRYNTVRDGCACSSSRHEGDNNRSQWNKHLSRCLCSNSNISHNGTRRSFESSTVCGADRRVADISNSGEVCPSVAAAEASCSTRAGDRRTASMGYHSSHTVPTFGALSSLQRNTLSFKGSSCTAVALLTRGVSHCSLSRTLCVALSKYSFPPFIPGLAAADTDACLRIPAACDDRYLKCTVGALSSQDGAVAERYTREKQPSLQGSQQQQQQQKYHQHRFIDAGCRHRCEGLPSAGLRALVHQRRYLHMGPPWRSPGGASVQRLKMKKEMFFFPSALVKTPFPAAAAAAAYIRLRLRSGGGMALHAPSFPLKVNCHRRRSSAFTTAAAAAAKPHSGASRVSPGATAQQQQATTNSTDAAAAAPPSTQQQRQTQQTPPHATTSQQPQGRSAVASSPPPVARPRLRGAANSSSSKWRSFFSVFGLSGLAWRLVVSLGAALLRGLRTCFKYLRLIISNPMIVKKFWKKGKESAIHTWRWTVTGFSLFYANVRVSYQLLKKKILGHPLRYNEHKLLVRTTADALKLIPFSLMIVIPLGELLLPVMLRLFPNMLPSTFFEKQVDNAYLSRKLKAKQELAAFFQELVREHTKHIIEHESNDALKDKAKALREFQEKLLRKDQKDVNPFLSLKEILSFAKLFKEEFVLEKLDLQTLQVMCKLLGIEPYSLQSHVVLQLRYHLNNIQREDREFMWEGVETLSHDELVEACKDRAMMFHSISDEDMREQMRQWLEISSHKDIPPLLLLWCRCITLTHRPIPPPAVDLSGPAPAAASKAAAAAVPAGAAGAAAVHAAEGTGVSEKKEPGVGGAAPVAPAAAAAASLEQQQQWAAGAVAAGGHVLTQQEAESAAAAATTDEKLQQQRVAAAQPLEHRAATAPAAAEDRGAAATAEQQQQQEPSEKREEEEAEDEDEKVKKATLEAMERQVELLRAEEETLRQSVWLLQEEEAHRKEVQAAEEAERLKAESLDETVDSSSPSFDTHSADETDTAHREHKAAAAHDAAEDAALKDSSSRKGAAAAAAPTAEKEEEQQHIKTRPLGLDEARDTAATGTSTSPGADAEDDASLNELARVRSGREMLQRRARRMELELKLLRRLADMQHHQQEEAFGALSKVLQAAHACRTKQQALQQLEQLRLQQQGQQQLNDKRPAGEHLQQHLDAERDHQQEVQRQQKQHGDPVSAAATAAAAAGFPESVAQLEVCVEDVIHKFAEGVQQVEQLMRDAKRLQMNDTDPLFYPEDHSDMEDICTLSGSAPLTHAEQSHTGASTSSSSAPVSPASTSAAAGTASSSASRLPASSASDGAFDSHHNTNQPDGGRGEEAQAEEEKRVPLDSSTNTKAAATTVSAKTKKAAAAHGGTCV